MDNLKPSGNNAANLKKYLLPVGGVVAIVIIAAVYFSSQQGTNEISQPSPISDEEAALQRQELTGVSGDSFTDAAGNYTVDLPAGWFAYQTQENVTLFLQQSTLTVPLETDEALGPSFLVGINTLADVPGVSTPEEWLAAHGLTEDDPLNLSVALEEVTVNGREMTRVTQGTGASNGQVIHYIYFPDDLRAISFSHFPYVTGSAASEDFELVVQSFVPQAVIE